MSQTAVAGSGTGLSPAELARQHGLSAAGRLPSLPEYTRSLWSYRHFISAFANAKVSAALGNTRLGMMWQVLTPIINAGVYYVIFGILINTRRSVDNFIAYLCIGVFIFGFSQSVVQAGVQAVTGNLGLIRALHFPRASLPISTALVEIRNMGVSMLVLIAIVLFSGEPITWQWLLVVPALCLQSIFNSGLAMFVARLGTKFHDIRQLIPFIMRIWLYGSAVIYPVTNFTAHLHGWKLYTVEANPLLVYIELIRHALMQNIKLAGTPMRLWLEALAWAIVVGFGGFVYFWRGEKGMAVAEEVKAYAGPEPTVIADNAHIIYRIHGAAAVGANTPVAGFKRLVTRERSASIREVHAVKGVSFIAYKGEAIGLIGSNGSGKSTLLRAIAGLLPVEQGGAIYAAGQPSLLGVNAALMNDLSGERNVELGCLAMGMTPAEVKAQTADIIEFSGINERGDFGSLPMKTYSSGMAARLRFSIAAAKRHDVLLIDEALATGDAKFRKRSEQRVRDLRAEAGTVFLVSHSEQSIRDTCERSIWLESGVIRADGPTEDVMKEYESYVNK